jgi:hypothetical protein
MIRPFKPAPRGYRWVYVIIDKFSKWIEYKPLVSGTAKKVAELLDEIIHCKQGLSSLPPCLPSRAMSISQS